MSKDAITIFAIDPGPQQSAYALLSNGQVELCGIQDNSLIPHALNTAMCANAILAIEWVECYGMKVGKDVFETVYWIGRFDELCDGGLVRVPRRSVKLYLCDSMRAKDANVRQALIDRFPATGGGKTPQIGTKKQPGPLFGVKSHIWSALAVAVTVAAEKEQQDG